MKKREQKGIVEALELSERRFRALYHESPAMFLTVDERGLILSVNELAAGYFGYRPSELVHRPVLDLIPADEHASAAGRLAEVIGAPANVVHRGERRVRTRSGEIRWVRDAGRVLEEGDGARLVLITLEDITDNRRLEDALRFSETHDGLTGLLNREEFLRQLGEHLDEAEGARQGSALAVCDLDQFKVVNGTCGSDAGDALLRRVAELMRSALAPSDLLGRLGADEFAILFRGCSLERARRLSERLLAKIYRERFRFDERSFALSASAGVVSVGERTPSAGFALALADAACRAAKELGRNRVCVDDDQDADLARRRAEMYTVSEIVAALEENRFELVGQAMRPLDPAVSGEHFEVLLRMVDRDGRFVSPGLFLPAAERFNLAREIDRWVVSATLRRLADAPVALESIAHCGINLSASSLSDERMLAHIDAELAAHAVPTEKICFEITETAAIDHLPRARTLVKQLRERGCRFAIDDFGSGLSSFSYLRNLPVDFVKIDGVFVRDMANSSVDRAIVRAVHDVARVMGTRTIAEFVENDEIVSHLEEIGVDYAQGYGIGRPEPLTRWLPAGEACAVER